MNSVIEERIILEKIYLNDCFLKDSFESDKNTNTKDYSNSIQNNSEFLSLGQISNDIGLEEENDNSNFKFDSFLLLDNMNFSNDEEKIRNQETKVTKNTTKLDSKIEENKLFNYTKNQLPKIEPSSSGIPNPNFNPNSKSRKYFRVDDAKKHFKVAISKFATEKVNSLIQESNLPKRLKKKIHLPHFKHFTSNVKEFDNFEFLSYDMKTIFIYGKNEGNLQEKNDEIISKIWNYKKIPENVKKIKDFLSLKYEDIIKLFYRSKNFDEFKKYELTDFFTTGMKKEKNIELLKNDGLVTLFQMTKKKRKRELFTLM
jgi:hypothetical protein